MEALDRAANLDALAVHKLHQGCGHVLGPAEFRRQGRVVENGQNDFQLFLKDNRITRRRAVKPADDLEAVAMQLLPHRVCMRRAEIPTDARHAATASASSFSEHKRRFEMASHASAGMLFRLCQNLTRSAGKASFAANN